MSECVMFIASSEIPAGKRGSYAPTDSERKFYKTGIGNWLLIVFNLVIALIGNSHS